MRAPAVGRTRAASGAALVGPVARVDAGLLDDERAAAAGGPAPVVGHVAVREGPPVAEVGHVRAEEDPVAGRPSAEGQRSRAASRAGSYGPSATVRGPNEQRSPVRVRRCPATVVPRSSRASQVACSGRLTRHALEDERFGRQAPVVRLLSPRTTGGRAMRRSVSPWLGALACSPRAARTARAPGGHGTAPPTTTAPTSRAGHDRRADHPATFPVSVNTPDGSGDHPGEADAHRVVVAHRHRDAVRRGRRAAGRRRRRPVGLPPEAPRTNLSGFTPNLEAILPTTRTSSWSPTPREVEAGLAAAKVPVLVQEAASTLDDTYAS